MVEDKLNVPLEDAELLAEVELTTNLIIAASEADQALTQAQIDELLGLSPDTADAEGRVSEAGGRPADTPEPADSEERETPPPDIPTQHRRSD